MTAWMVALLTVLFYQVVCFVVWLSVGEEDVVAVVATAPLYYIFRNVQRLYHIFRLKYVKKHYALYSFMRKNKNGTDHFVSVCMKTVLEKRFHLDNTAEFFIKKYSDGSTWRSLPDRRFWPIYKGQNSYRERDMTPWMK